MKRLVCLGALLLTACSQRPATKDVPVSQKESSPYQVVFEYEKLNASETPEGVGEAYRLIGYQFPIGQKFTLFGKNLKQEEVILNHFFVDSKGQLMTRDDPKGSFALSDILFKTGHFMKGEPYEYILASEDGLTRASLVTVPQPIEVISKDGASLSMHLASADSTQFMLYGKGFQPEESVEVVSRSGKEKISKRLTADQKGDFTLSLLPAVIGQQGGKAFLEVQRKQEKLFLNYTWGHE